MSKPYRTPPSTWRPSSFHPILSMLSGSIKPMFASEKPEEQAEMARHHAGAMLKDRPREESDKTDPVKRKWVWYRLKYDRDNLVILRENLDPHSDGVKPINRAVRALVETIKTVIEELDKAAAKAPNSDGIESNGVLTDPDFPDPPDTPTGPAGISIDDIIQ